MLCTIMQRQHDSSNENKIMNGNQGDHVTCVNMASKKANIEILSHISIYSTPRCRCRAQTYTPEPRCHTSYTCGLVWVVRLWIYGRGSTMCSKCHACMPVWKMDNPCAIHLKPQPYGKPDSTKTAPTRETLIQIWTTCLFLDVNITNCGMPSVV